MWLCLWVRIWTTYSRSKWRTLQWVWRNNFTRTGRLFHKELEEWCMFSCRLSGEGGSVWTVIIIASGDQYGALHGCWAGNTVTEEFQTQESMRQDCDAKMNSVCVCVCLPEWLDCHWWLNQMICILAQTWFGLKVIIILFIITRCIQSR